MRSMISWRPSRRWAAALLGAAFFLLSPLAAAAGETGDGCQLLAQASTEQEDGELAPRYQPREPEVPSWYNSGYVFGMTRGVADSTIHPAGKAPLFVLTLPLDLALLPFTLIGGMFG
jgi:anti-sigma factor RsiW